MSIVMPMHSFLFVQSYLLCNLKSILLSVCHRPNGVIWDIALDTVQEYTYEDIDFSGPAYWYTVLVPVPVSLFFLINDIFNLETSFYFSFSVVVVLTRFQLTHNITVGFFDLLVFGAVAFILC
jgi:hypothetical protein